MYPPCLIVSCIGWGFHMAVRFCDMASDIFHALRWLYGYKLLSLQSKEYFSQKSHEW